MSRKPTSSIVLTALLATLAASPVLAQQTTPQVPAQSAQQTPAEPAVLPQALQDAGLTDVTSKPMRHGGGIRIEGTLPEGGKIGAFVDASGALRGVRNQDDAALPASLIDALVPQNVRDNPVYGELAQLRGIFVGQQGVKLFGIDAQDNRVHAAFSEDGTLVRFGRGDGDDDRRGFGKDRGDGKHRDGEMRRHDRKYDGKRHEGRGKDRHGMKGDRGDRRSHGAQDSGSARPPVDEAALRQSLTDNGYSDIGTITHEGPRLVAEAVNPEGEAVAVEINPRGEVLREINR